MKWFRNTWSIYYGNGNGDGTKTIYDVVCGPYLYNGKLYGTADNPLYSIYLLSALLDQDTEISPVSGHSVSYNYFRVAGVTDETRDLSSWGSEISGATISGQYKFHENIAGAMFGGWSIPCNFVLTKPDGTTFAGDSLQSTGTTSRFPGYSFCGIVWSNVREGTSIRYGSNSSGDTSATLSADQQYSIVDFGDSPQEIPAFIKSWIEANAEVVVEPSAALPISMRSPKGIRLHTEKQFCDRDIEVTPTLQEKTATENGEVTPDAGYCGLGKVTVDVPIPDGYIQPSGTVTITENGTHDVSGYASAEVNVPSEEPVLQEKTATENGEVTPDAGYDGLSKVTVVVESSGSDDTYKTQLAELIERTATELTVPDSVTSIGDYAFRNYSNLTDIHLPAGLTSIGDYAFHSCSGLALTSLPAGLTNIGALAFSGCSGLALTSLPAGLTSIYANAFKGCSGLALTSLPAGLTNIGAQVFNGCTGLTTITFEGTPDAIAGTVFTGCDNLTTINVPWAEGEVAQAPWGATNATINYNYTGE